MLKGRFLTLKMALGLCAVAAGTSPTLAGEDHRTPIACTEFDEGKDGLCGHAVAGMARFQRERALLTQQREDSDDTDVTHCLLDIEITLSPNTVTGSNTIDVTSRIDGLTEMTLDLFSDMTVDAVSVNGGPAAYTRPTDQIVITLDQAYDTGQSFQIKVDYHGAPYHLSAAAGYSGTHGSPPVDIVASHSQPYNSPAWWPCKEAIDDKFTLDMWVTVPDWMIVASNGLLQGTDVVAGGRKRYRWYESYPISVYLVSIAATNYST
ncbi:MAG: M1 family metallopeptidase, partial [bacterium]|nr:M1 family metallopeptidase [bacterium]